jgi:hypothetical protein
MRRPNPSPVLASIRKFFYDNFQRENTESGLSLSSTGRAWDAVRGVFKIQGNRAVTTSDPGEHPIATVIMPYKDVDISLKDIDSGSGAALWITDSGEWWGVGLQQEEVDCNCTLNSECNRWNARNCAAWNGQECFQWGCRTWSGSTSTGCRTWSGSNCASWNRIVRRWECVEFNVFGNCRRYGLASVTGGNCSSTNFNICTSLNWSANNCTGFVCNAANASNCRAFNNQTCNRWFEFTTDCETCYPQYVRVFQSISSTISTVFSAIVTKTFEVFSSPGGLTLYSQSDLSSPRARSMKLAVRNDSVSVEVFSDQNLSDKIILDDEIVYGPTGAIIPTAYGIMVNPSEYNQNNYIGEINIDRA